MYSFEQDENKNTINKAKHGVDFEESSTVFYDERALIEYDEYHSDDEDRFRILGYSSYGNILLVVHCIAEETENDTVIRIVSSRKATDNERRNYEGGLGL